MIQDIYPHILANPYDKDAKPEEQNTVFCFKGKDTLVKTEGELRFPKVSDFEDKSQLTYLFRLDEEPYFLYRGEGEAQIEGFEYLEARKLRYMGLGETYMIFALYTAKHLSDWYRDMRHCGRCGKKMIHTTTERAMKCECGYRAYPRIMPAVIVGVTNGDHILLTKYRTGFGFNALIAGFTEIGETLEETVAREVMEEAGLNVKNIRYYKSQPWGIANDILMGFYCDVDGDTTIHMDKNELKYAEWVYRDDIELQPDEFSLTNEMMKMFKEGKNI